MEKKLKNIWESFIEDTQNNTANKNAFINAVIRWLITNKDRLNKNLLLKYGIEKYVTIKPEDFPVEYSEMNPIEEFRQIKNHPPSNEENFIMRLRDIIWQSITYRSGIICSQCEGDELKTLFDPNTISIVLACDICTWAQLPNGKKWDGLPQLIPATKKQLNL
jgi:hypothetical protein